MVEILIGLPEAADSVIIFTLIRIFFNAENLVKVLRNHIKFLISKPSLSFLDSQFFQISGRNELYYSIVWVLMDLHNQVRHQFYPTIKIEPLILTNLAPIVLVSSL